jgi:hypothetical protein
MLRKIHYVAKLSDHAWVLLTFIAWSLGLWLHLSCQWITAFGDTNCYHLWGWSDDCDDHDDDHKTLWLPTPCLLLDTAITLSVMICILYNMAVTLLFPVIVVLHSLPVCIGNMEVIRGTVCPGWGCSHVWAKKTGTWNSVKLVIESHGTQPVSPEV